MQQHKEQERKMEEEAIRHIEEMKRKGTEQSEKEKKTIQVSEDSLKKLEKLKINLH